MATGFRLPFGRDERPKGEMASASTFVSPSAQPTEVELDAFADDCRLGGRLTLSRDRLLELLNGDEPIVLRDLRVVTLLDGHVIELSELVVERDELLLVVADGPRGDPARRLHTRTADVQIELGPYLVSGALHGTPASDPLVAVLRRRAFVPVTDAVVRFAGDHGEVVLAFPCLLINRTRAAAFHPIHEHHPVLADAPERPQPTDAPPT